MPPPSSAPTPSPAPAEALVKALTEAIDEAEKTADSPRWASIRNRWYLVIASDRRVLARHALVDRWWGTDMVICCGYCAGMTRWPCPDILDLAFRYPTPAVIKAMIDLGQEKWIADVTQQL